MNLLRRLHTTARSSSGTSLIELAAVMPLVLSLALGAFEISKILLTQQALSTLSRESANAAFRACAFVNQAQVAACLAGVKANFDSYSSSVFSGAAPEIVLSVYQYNDASSPNPDTVQLKGQEGIITDPSDTRCGLTALGRIPKYRPPPADPDDPVCPDDMLRVLPKAQFKAASVDSRNIEIIIAEVFYTYSPSITPRLEFFSYFSVPIYEATIL